MSSWELPRESRQGSILMIRPEGEAQNQGNNLHVSGLARTVDVAMLEAVFGKIGKVRSSNCSRRETVALMSRSTRPRSCPTPTPVCLDRFSAS